MKNQTKTKRNHNPIGVKGINQWGGSIYEEYLDKLRFPQAAKVYKEMATSDPVIGAVLYMITQLVRGAGWSVEPHSLENEDVERAEFLKSCMDDMDTSWAEFMQEVLSEFTYGFSFHEILYKVRSGENKNPNKNSTYTDRKIGWRGMPIRSQSTLYHWEFDDKGNAIAFVQMTHDGQQFTIPFSKGILFKTKNERGNPEGQSLLRAAYKPWYFKTHIEEIEGIGIERDLAGMPVLHPAEGDDIWNPDDEVAVAKKKVAEQLVQRIRRDEIEGIVLPHGWELDLLAAAGNRQFNTNQIINRYDQRIAITLLADIVLLGSDKVGSFALADIKKSLLATSLESQLNNICDILNRYAVKQLFLLNGMPVQNLPKITVTDIEVPSIDNLSKFLDSATNAGMKLFPDSKVENYLRRLVSIPEKRYTIEDLKNEEKIRKANALKVDNKEVNNDGNN